TGLEGHQCVALDYVASGMNNIVRLLEFSNGRRWAARVHIKRNDRDDTAKLASEIATMQLIKEHSQVPVPEVFGFDVHEDNPVGAAFILMELLPGSVVMDTLGGHKVHHGVIAKEYRQAFYRSVAKHHVDLAHLRLPKIGSVIRSPDGGYDCGPIPGIGGPFDTASEFFEAWADSVKFNVDNETITKMMQRGPISAEKMIEIIENFPAQIKAMASRLSLHNEGPFPLSHDDFLHSTIMVDGDFNVTGIIDWEGACTVPCELVGFPDFLTGMPASFDLPQKYDGDGQPLSEELREVWREREGYVEMVRSVEQERATSMGHADYLLSDCLGSSRSQAIAYSYGAYTCIGKLGFYDRVVKELSLEK
ncbi:hypothetical protein N7456_002561, partial [Penicillium angulare]